MTDDPTTIDEIPWTIGDEKSERIRLSTPRPCQHRGRRHHENRTVGDVSLIVEVCDRCGHVFDPGRQRLGRRAVRRGKDAERRIAKMTGRRRIGHRGGDVDVGDQADPDVFQVKSGPTYWPRAIVRELDKLEPSRAGRPRFVAYVETPGPGHRVRVVVALYLHDLPVDVAVRLFPAVLTLQTDEPIVASATEAAPDRTTEIP